jgi:hypothetical protein
MLLRLLACSAAIALMSASGSATDLVEPPPAETAFWLEGSVLFMKREFTDNPDIVSTDTAPQSNVFKANDFEPGWEAGFEAALGVRWDRWGVEARGFWLDTFEENQTFIGTGDDLVIETDPPTSYGLSAGNTLDGSFESDIYGAEASVSFEVVPNATIYAGPRWINFDEEFELFGDFGGGASETNTWETDNELLGAQLGFRTDLIALATGSPGAFSVNTDVSVGIFDNQAEADFQVLDGGVPRPDADVSDDESILAFAVDAELTVGYEVTENILVFVGYQVLYIDGVANAVEQVDGTTSFNNDPTIDIRRGSALFHGGKAGVTIRF